jgi:SSS family solute:Na+ symporter
VGVAAFAFCFSLGFTQTHYIAMWWKITEAIFVSGAGAAIIGGLYWRKGTTSAAWSSVVVGAVLAFTGILLNQYWPDILAKWASSMARHGMNLPAAFPLNGTEVAFVAMLIASAVYVIVSFLTTRGDFNLDQMLHRGRYATEAETPKPRRSLLARMANIDENFTKGDRRIAFMVVGFTLVLAVINGVVAIFNIFLHQWTLQSWAHFWLIFGVALPFTIGTVTFIWFTIGGVRDMGRFFRDLKTLKRDARDDGRVYDHQNLDTKTLVEEGQLPVTADVGKIPMTKSE